MFSKSHILGLMSILALTACKQQQQEPVAPVAQERLTPDQSFLKESLSFYSSFDAGTDAVVAGGDKRMYSVPNRKQRDSARLGMHKAGVSIAAGKGRFGNALEYAEDSKGYIYYQSKGNMEYATQDWEGAISFWLSLDPALDLEPGYCDPIQITDSGYNDAGFWVDFTKENPRDFRLGVIGDRDSWNPNPEGPDNENPNFISQLGVVKEAPFQRGVWTHVVMNFIDLNTDNGKAAIYINGEMKALRTGIKDPFTWELEKSNIYLGLSYIGLMDEVSIYNKHLSKEQIKALYALENGVQGLLE